MVSICLFSRLSHGFVVIVGLATLCLFYDLSGRGTALAAPSPSHTSPLTQYLLKNKETTKTSPSPTFEYSLRRSAPTSPYCFLSGP